MEARHYAMYACINLTRNGYADIGRFFDRDHTSVMYAEQKISGLSSQKQFQDYLEYISGVAKI